MCEDTPELSLLADVVSTGISCIGLYEKPLLKPEYTSMQLAYWSRVQYVPLSGLRHKKTCIYGLKPDKPQTSLLSYRIL